MDAQRIHSVPNPPDGDHPAEGIVAPSDPHDETMDEPLLGEEGLLEIEKQRPL